MRKFAVVVLAVAVAAVFALPVMAADCGCPKPCTCAKPCGCPKPAPQPCVTCGQPCNILQSSADAINCMKAPNLCPKCTSCPKPAAPACGKCGKSH